MVGGVDVKAPLHGVRRHPERTPAHRELDGPEVGPIDRARTYEGVDLGDEASKGASRS